MDEVDPSQGVMITAQGLLMYLQPPEVRRVLAACAGRFPGGTLLFDAVPRWFSARTMRGAMTLDTGYAPPPMPWGMDADERSKIKDVHPNIIDVQGLLLPRGRGPFFGRVFPWANRVPAVRNKGLFPPAAWSITRLRFAGMDAPVSP